jgi:hypothetical protein
VFARSRRLLCTAAVPHLPRLSPPVESETIVVAGRLEHPPRVVASGVSLFLSKQSVSEDVRDVLDEGGFGNQHGIGRPTSFDEK